METEIIRRYYPNGKIETEETFLFGTQIRHGIQTWYYKSGQKYTELTRVNNKWHGIKLNWNKNGTIHTMDQLLNHSSHGPIIIFKY
jgi:antitoxin component YwqK of YwqJK toxin-antitoxin module